MENVTGKQTLLNTLLHTTIKTIHTTLTNAVPKYIPFGTCQVNG